VARSNRKTEAEGKSRRRESGADGEKGGAAARAEQQFKVRGTLQMVVEFEKRTTQRMPDASVCDEQLLPATSIKEDSICQSLCEDGAATSPSPD
jgi:hypothetical protein